MMGLTCNKRSYPKRVGLFDMGNRKMENRTKAARLNSFIDAWCNARTDYEPIPIEKVIELGMTLDKNARLSDMGDTFDIVFDDGSIATFTND